MGFLAGFRFWIRWINSLAAGSCGVRRPSNFAADLSTLNKPTRKLAILNRPSPQSLKKRRAAVRAELGPREEGGQKVRGPTLKLLEILCPFPLLWLVAA